MTECCVMERAHTVMFCYIAQCRETRFVKDKADAYTHTSKPTSATDSVEIGLWVWFRVATTLHWDVIVDNH